VERREQADGVVGEVGEEERRKERQRAMWGVMDEVLGH
jgi:hypothetical protein